MLHLLVSGASGIGAGASFGYQAHQLFNGIGGSLVFLSMLFVALAFIDDKSGL